MQKFILPIALFIFLFLITSSNVGAQSSDCWKEYSDIKPICDQAVTEHSLLEKCDQANNTFHQCLGVDKNTWKLESSNPGHLTCGEWKKLMIVGTAQNCVAPLSEIFERKLWCLSSVAEMKQVRSHPVDYILDFDPNSCIITEDDLRQFKAGLPLTSGSSSQVQNQQTKLPSASGNNSNVKTNPLNVLSINPLETWRNIQGLLSIPEGLNSLVQTAEILSGPTEIKIQVPEPSIATDSEGKPWDFLPGYIPPEEGKISILSGQGQIKPPDSSQFISVINTGNSSEMVVNIFLGSTFKNSYADVAQLSYIWETNSGALINVSPQSEVKFLKPTQDEKTQELKRMVKLNKGEIEVKVKQANKKEKFGIQTDLLDLIVIGTHFWVKNDPEKKQTLVGVYEGKVEVKTKDGKTTTVTPNGDKPGVVVVAQKLSVIKLAVAGLVLAAIIFGLILFLKRRGIKSVIAKRKR